MDTKTLEALNASIAKWERNAEARAPGDAQIFSNTCPLCTAFRVNGWCDGCPVKSRTGRSFCALSPWEDALIALGAWDSGNTKQGRSNFRVAARKEVAFLKSLLPTEARQP